MWFVLSVWPHSSFAPTALGSPLVADAQPQEQADLAQLQLAARPLRVERAPGAAVWLFQMTPTAQEEARTRATPQHASAHISGPRSTATRPAGGRTCALLAASDVRHSEPPVS